jgi:subtilisin-like proprotein convertase family protein
VLCLAAAAFVASPAGAATYSNPTPILDPTQGLGGNQPDQPYPSTISVSGEQGTIVKATATLIGVSGGYERDLDVLLTGPGGSTILLSDICSVGGFVPDFPGSLTLTLDDDASSALPDACMSGSSSGTYKPTNYDTADNFPGIAPPYPLGLANVRGTSPNGAWNLYVVDDTYPDPVTISGGWSIDLTTTGAPAATAPVPPTTTTTTRKKCKRHKRRSAAAAKKRCKKKRL